MADVNDITFSNTDWINLNVVPGALTIKNNGGTPVSVIIKDTNVVPVDSELTLAKIDPLEIGGLISELTVENGKFIFAKSISGTGSVQVRKYGVLDPTEDIEYLANLLNQVSQSLMLHESDVSNPHNTTKDQVDLGNIPNAISDNPATNDSNVLATTKATSSLIDQLSLHINNDENPHVTTKNQVGLGNVKNFGIATLQEAVNQEITDKYLTPYTMYRAVQSWIQIAMSMPSQMVVKGHEGIRPNLWSYLDCNNPTLLIEKATDTTIRIFAGLQVSFADAGKTRLSTIVDNETTLALPMNHVDGCYYVYCNVENNTNIESFGMTQLPYKEGMNKNSHTGDFFSIPENVTYDPTGTSVRRVYIGKCYVNGGIIVATYSTPIGKSTILPATTALVLGSRDLYENPFCSSVDTVAEVEYNGTWGPTEWNDQIGVISHPYPSQQDKIILQSGLMGFLSCGRESGSPFGANFLTVTTPPRARIRVQKRY